MRPVEDAHILDRLLQYFWDDAGAYGRVSCSLNWMARTALTAAVEQRLRDWEADSVSVLTLNGAPTPAGDHQAALIDSATALLLLTARPLDAIARIGGTALAKRCGGPMPRARPWAAHGDGPRSSAST
ncbi:MAG: hypothetical protein R2838_20725 [Caldilineaceae bacterium]